jgi:hypothetical protein
MVSIKFSQWRSSVRSHRLRLEPCFAEISVRYSQGKHAFLYQTTIVIFYVVTYFKNLI